MNNELMLYYMDIARNLDVVFAILMTLSVLLTLLSPVLFGLGAETENDCLVKSGIISLKYASLLFVISMAIKVFVPSEETLKAFKEGLDNERTKRSLCIDTESQK